LKVAYNNLFFGYILTGETAIPDRTGVVCIINQLSGQGGHSEMIDDGKDGKKEYHYAVWKLKLRLGISWYCVLFYSLAGILPIADSVGSDAMPP
jgi:hypothetical protein